MNLKEMKLGGAFVIELKKLEDNRGFFTRARCKRVFEAHGLIGNFVQSNICFTRKAGTLRGLHYQVAPHEEAKLVRCTNGAIYDVIIDLRPQSRTYLEWVAVELTADKYKLVYVPEGFAHGYQTLVDSTEVVYQVSEFYAPAAERGVRYDDPVFKITWPIEVGLISDKDRGWPDYRP